MYVTVIKYVMYFILTLFFFTFFNRIIYSLHYKANARSIDKNLPQGENTHQ